MSGIVSSKFPLLYSKYDKLFSCHYHNILDDEKKKNLTSYDNDGMHTSNRPFKTIRRK